MSFLKDFKKYKEYNEFLDIKPTGNKNSDGQSINQVGLSSDPQGPVQQSILSSVNKMGTTDAIALKKTKEYMVDIANNARKAYTDVSDSPNLFNFSANETNVFIADSAIKNFQVKSNIKTKISIPGPNEKKTINIVSSYTPIMKSSIKKLNDLTIEDNKLEIEKFNTIIVGHGGIQQKNFKKEIIFANIESMQ